jgi:hypothetical protein
MATLIGKQIDRIIFPPRDVARELSAKNKLEGTTFRIHNIKYHYGGVEKNLEYVYSPSKTMAKDAIIFFHGNLRSATQCVPDILNGLTEYGDVFGMNLPGYGESTPPERLMDRESIFSAAVIAFTGEIKEKYPHVNTFNRIIAVGRSIGAGCAIQSQQYFPKHMHCCILLVPMGNIVETVEHKNPFYLGSGFSSSVQTLYPNCFDNFKLMERYSPIQKLVVFQVKNDELIPPNTGDRLIMANQGIGYLHQIESEKGHKALPDEGIWATLFSKLD